MLEGKLTSDSTHFFAIFSLSLIAFSWTTSYSVSSTSELPVHDANTRGLLQYIATGEIIENHNFRNFNNPDEVPDVQSFVQSQINDVETEVDNNDQSSTNFHPPGNIVDVESPEGNHDNDSDENTEEMDQDKLQNFFDDLEVFKNRIRDIYCLYKRQ